jgi:DNA-binding transcriptional ArsR family regulator
VTAIQKHVAVLERAGLVVRTRQGREQLVQSQPETISRARGLLAEFEGLWRDRLDRIDDLVKEPDAGDRRWP